MQIAERSDCNRRQPCFKKQQTEQSGLQFPRCTFLWSCCCSFGGSTSVLPGRASHHPRCLKEQMNLLPASSIRSISHLYHVSTVYLIILHFDEQQSYVSLVGTRVLCNSSREPLWKKGKGRGGGRWAEEDKEKGVKDDQAILPLICPGRTG